MKEHKKKEKLGVADRPDSQKEFEEPLDMLLEVVVSELNKQASKGNDPFETYQYQLHSHLYQNLPEFRERFIKGYKLLLEEV